MEFFSNFDFSWLYRGIMLIYGATVIAIIGIIISENRSPVKSLAWVTVLVLLPLVGLILYLFFGRNIKNTRMISRRNRRKLRRREPRIPFDPKTLDLTTESLQEISLARTLTGAQFYPGNSVEIYTGGDGKFNRLLSDIAAARRYINIQYYIVEDDATGRRLADALKEKVKQGVTVRLIYDHVGSFSVSSGFFRRLREAGIQAYPFFKVSFPQFGTRINWRNHRKICVIDGEVGYIGGMNVADRYITGGKFPVWRDTHLRVSGPVVHAMQFCFAIDWNFMGRPLLEEEHPAVENECFRPRPYAISGVGAQLLASGPTSQWSNIAMALHKAIANARKRVFIQTPYFLPTEGLLKALSVAALAKVDVRVMIPRRSDSAMLTRASASYVAECMRAGIKFYTYDAGMLHAKTIIVDDEFSSVGSTNFDFRSFEYNFEANLLLYSRELNSRMTDIFRADLLSCTRITPASWRSRPITDKAIESIVRLLSPVL